MLGKTIRMTIIWSFMLLLSCLPACESRPNVDTAQGAIQLLFDSLGEGNFETAYCLLSADLKDSLSKDLTRETLNEFGYRGEIEKKHQRAFMALLIGMYNSIDIQPIEQEIREDKASVKIRLDIPDFNKILMGDELIDQEGRLVEDSALGKLVAMAEDEQSDRKLCEQADRLAKTTLARNTKLEGPIHFRKDSDKVWRLTFPEPDSEKFEKWINDWKEALDAAQTVRCEDKLNGKWSMSYLFADGRGIEAGAMAGETVTFDFDVNAKTMKFAVGTKQPESFDFTLPSCSRKDMRLSVLPAGTDKSATPAPEGKSFSLSFSNKNEVTLVMDTMESLTLTRGGEAHDGAIKPAGEYPSITMDNFKTALFDIADQCAKRIEGRWGIPAPDNATDEQKAAAALPAYEFNMQQMTMALKTGEVINVQVKECGEKQIVLMPSDADPAAKDKSTVVNLTGKKEIQVVRGKDAPLALKLVAPIEKCEQKIHGPWVISVGADATEEEKMAAEFGAALMWFEFDMNAMEMSIKIAEESKSIGLSVKECSDEQIVLLLTDPERPGQEEPMTIKIINRDEIQMIDPEGKEKPMTLKRKAAEEESVE